MSAFKDLGSNLRVQYKNVWLDMRKIRLTFGFFLSSSFLSWFFLIFLLSLSFHELGNIENALFLTITLWRSTKLIILTLELIKNGGVGVLSTMSSIRKGIFHSHKIWTMRIKKGLKKNSEENKKTKKWATLDHNLHFGSTNHELSFKMFFFGMDQLVFLPKWCHVGQITIWFVFILNPCLNALILYLFCVLLQITIISATCPIGPSVNSTILIFLNFYWTFNNKNYSKFNSWHTLSLKNYKTPSI
jgi:hypothetical protein